MSKFKISSVGLDTTNLNYIPRRMDEEELEYDYFYTNPSANNGLVIQPLIRETPNASLVVGIDFLDHSLLAIRAHLYELGKSHIDVLMFDSECKFSEYEDVIKEIKETDLVSFFGIKNPEKLTIDQLKELKDKYGISCLGINLCPLYFNKDILDWANMENLDIFSFNPLGGYINAPSLIDAFSISYLLNFSSVYSDVIMLSGKDLVFSSINKTYLNSLVDREIEKDSIYRIKKNVNKLAKPLKKISQVSIKVGEERFPVSESDVVFNPEEFIVSLKGSDIAENIIIDKSIDMLEEDDKPGRDILGFLEDASIPKDTSNPKDHMAVLRPRIFTLFRSNFPESDGWFNFNVFLGDVYLFSAVKDKREKRWFSPDRVTTITHTYLLYYSDESKFVLRKLQNSELGDRDS